jgi:hypothetical protein
VSKDFLSASSRALALPYTSLMLPFFMSFLVGGCQGVRGGKTGGNVLAASPLVIQSVH